MMKYEWGRDDWMKEKNIPKEESVVPGISVTILKKKQEKSGNCHFNVKSLSHLLVSFFYKWHLPFSNSQ